MNPILSLLLFSLMLPTLTLAWDIDPSGFSLYSGGEFYVLTDGVFSSDQNIKVRFEAAGNPNLTQYHGVDVRLYRIPKPLEFLKSQKNLHRPSVKAQDSGEGLANVVSYLWDSWFKKARLAWQRVFSPEARLKTVKEVPALIQVPAHSYHTKFNLENQFAPLKGYDLVDTFRYPIWEAKPNEPTRDTVLEGSSSNFIRTAAGNVILPLGRQKPGLYLVEAMIGTYRATTLVFVSNSIIVTKVSSQQALVWTVNGQTGEGRAGSKIFLTDGVGVLDQGQADSDGVFVVKRSIPERTFALAEDQEGGVSVSENFFYDSEIVQSKIFVFTDRPLYQPGDKVSVRAFGRDLKRASGKEIWSALPGKSAMLSVIDSTGATLFSKKMEWDGANGGDLQLRLPDSAVSGGYVMKLNFEGEEYGAAFRVARFSKPHFESRIVFDKPAYKVGEEVKGKVILHYPSGQPVVDAEVDLQLRSEQMSIFEGSYSYTRAMPVELSTKTYKSDSHGEITFRFPPATKPSRYIASARSMDQGAFRVSSKKEVLIEGFLETYLLTSEFSSTDPGLPVKISYVRQGSEGDSNQALARWQAIRLEDRSVSHGTVSAVDRGEFVMQLEKPGHYVVRVVDINGVTRGTRSHVVLGEGLKSVTGQVEILPDRDSYSIGDTAKILLTFPYKEDDALLTLERNDVAGFGRLAGRSGWFKARRVNDFQWKVEVPILEAHSPNIIFSVAYAKNNDFGFQNKGLIVKKPAIDIIFTADKASYAPGERVIIKVETRLQDKPLSALVAVGVVDEMIYVLQPEIAPPITEFFYHLRRNQVRTSSSLSFYSFNPATSDAFAPNQTTSNRDLKLLQERTRRDAKDTAYWNGKLTTDANGRAQFEFIMPDALTRWRITGRAIALGAANSGAVGESRSFLLSTKEFYFKWTGPTRFRNLDLPKPALVAFNSGKKEIPAEVNLKGEKYSFSQKIQLRPGATTVVLDNAPTVSQQLDATIMVDGQVVDRLQVQLEFVPEHWAQQQSHSLDLNKAQKLSLPKDASNVRLKIMANSTYQFLRIADDLLDYPWGCVEQTSSRLIPVTMAVNALEKSGAPAEVVQNLHDRIADDRRRLVAMAGPNSVFTWWGDQTGENLLLTAHAYHADSRASKLLGIEIAKSSWEHLLSIYAKSPTMLFTDRAYTLWVLDQMNLPVSEQLRRLLTEIKRATATIPKTGKSAYSSAFMNSPEDDRALGLLIAGNVALKVGVPVDSVLSAEMETIANTPSASPGFLAAALLYRVQTRRVQHGSEAAEQILNGIRVQAPTIDRAMALSFVEQALPNGFNVKIGEKAFDLGSSWIKDPKSAVAAFYWKNSATTLPDKLPEISGAVGELIYDRTEEVKPNVNYRISRRLFRVQLDDSVKEEGSTGESLQVEEVKPGEVVDSRALYLDEVTVVPNGVTGRFLLLEVPLPSGGEVDGTTWGLSFPNFETHFSEPRLSAMGLSYSIPIEKIDTEKKFHQLVRFASRGRFQIPPVRISNMYRPAERAFEGDYLRREISVQ